MYERNTGTSSNHSLTFTGGENLSSFDCHSIALNDQETHLLLVGNHELAFINFEALNIPTENPVADNNLITPYLSDIKYTPLFDTCNTNRPVVQWNHTNTHQYAVAIDRLVRLYAIDHGRIHETNAFIDSQHQRPISTLSYSPHDPCWLLTGSLDGQIQVWDTRQCSAKSPANLKFTVSTPFSIRRIQWSSTKSDNLNQLAVQCDRCIRIYDIRRTDSYLLSSTDLEHTQRIISTDWTMQSRSIVSLSMDNSLRVFSSTGQLTAESLVNEQSPYTFSKIRTTSYDNLFVCASRDTITSTSGFVGWRWDEDQYLRPLSDGIISTTPSSIVDFCFVTNPRLLSLFNNFSSSRLNEELINRFLLLAWCRDGHLCLVDMDSTFRQAWNSYHRRTKLTSLSESSSSTSTQRASSIQTRLQMNRSNMAIMTMDVIKDEVTDVGESDDDDNAFQAMSASPPITAMESSETGDEFDYSTTPDRTDNTVTEVSTANELNSLLDAYGPCVIVELKNEQSRMCVVRCIYSLDNSLSFRVYLILSRHYPIISQLFVRFKLSTPNHDERLKFLQYRIQKMFDETSHNCFYRGQLCLHKCLVQLKNLFDAYYKQEKTLSTSQATTNTFNRKRDQSITNSEFDSPNDLMNNNTNNNNSTTTNNNSNQIFGPSSSSTRTSDSQISGVSPVIVNFRTCGARFSGGTHLICFGRISTGQQPSSAPVLTSLTDGTMSRPQSLPMRSTSLTVAKTRENSSTDDQTSYRPPTTNTVQIQHIPNNSRLPMFSAPVRSLLGTSVFNDHQRISTSYRRSLGQLIQPHSSVSIYDVSILLPVTKKLADDYIIDLNNALEMCQTNEDLTRKMGKDDLAHCWRLLGGLLGLQTNLSSDDSWFQTPIAQGLIKHLVSNYVINGDIQSASMFLLTMSQTPFLKTKYQSRLINDHDHDPILYSYGCLLHRWKHFYKRTQILSQIDHNCQSPAPFTQIIPTINIICSICLKPVLGQHFLCAVCAHGGHLTHMHEWFSSDEIKHRFCPEKDCTCRCIIKQQELLTMNTAQIQQQHQPQPHTPISTSRPYLTRQPSGGIRPL